MIEVELKKEFEKLFMVTDKTEMIGTAVNAKLNDVFEWIEQKVKHVKQPLPTNEEIELWAMRTYKEYEDSRWFEPLILAATWMRDLVMSNSSVEKKPEDLGDKICDYCLLEKKGVYSVPGGYKAGCEGSHCDEAYENYSTNNEDMDIHTIEEIIKLCTVLHDSPDSGIEEASGIDLVRMQLEDILQTLKRNKK